MTSLGLVYLRLMRLDLQPSIRTKWRCVGAVGERCASLLASATTIAGSSTRDAWHSAKRWSPSFVIAGSFAGTQIALHHFGRVILRGTLDFDVFGKLGQTVGGSAPSTRNTRSSAQRWNPGEGRASRCCASHQCWVRLDHRSGFQVSRLLRLEATFLLSNTTAAAGAGLSWQPAGVECPMRSIIWFAAFAVRVVFRRW